MSEPQRYEFSDRDVAVLARIAGCEPDQLRAELRRKPWRLHDLLSDPEVAAVVLDDELDPGLISPLLLFSVLAYRAADDLADATWVADWSGPRQRLPVFDVEPLVQFADEPRRLLFLARLLASFAVPRHAVVPVGALDLDGLVDWLDAVESDDRTELLWRLGDLALFLAGVCADRTGSEVLTPSQAERLGRSIGMDPGEALELIDPGSVSPGLDALEALGSRWYVAALADPTGDVPAITLDIARRFRPARRFLNHLADRYLAPLEPGFGFLA